MADLISRQAAIEASCTCHGGVHCNHYPCKDVQAIMDLPSAQPELCEDAVSRQRLLSDLKELVAAWKKHPVMAEQIKGVETAIGYVESIPSVKPEIIRCRDCKWQKDQSGSTAWLPCRALVTPPDFYCGRAERRTDERQT